MDNRGQGTIYCRLLRRTRTNILQSSQANNFNTLKWKNIENIFRTEFEYIWIIKDIFWIAQKDVIHSILKKRKQLDKEQTAAYINDTELFYRCIDLLMSQIDTIRNIMKGFSPKFARYIGMMKSSVSMNSKLTLKYMKT